MIPHRMFLAGTLLLAPSALVMAQESPLPPIVTSPAQPAAPAVSASAGHVFAPAETIAVVGDQHILAGDMLGEINQMLAPYQGKVPEDEIEEQRQKLMRQLLPNMVENKILYLEFLRQVPADRIKDVREKLNEEFDAEKLETAMQRAKVNSPQELDALLRQYGSSLEKQRRTYAEQKLGRAMLGKTVNYKPEITHDEMLAYYRDHASEFDISAKARWEQLTVRFDRHPSKDAAWAKIAGMGNEVLRGAPFAAVAKKHSEGSNASEGGQYDWVTRGSLASQAIDTALFTLPIGKLSPIIEDDRGFHIMRVIERNEASRVDFVAAQEDIKEKLRRQKIQEQVAAYVEDLKAKTRVWTAFDGETEVARQPSGNGGSMRR